MNLPVAFDHCVVHVSNWERSNRFYREVLGAEVIDRGERFVYRFGETQLNLHGPGLKTEPLARVPVPPGGAISALPGKVQSKMQYNTCAAMVYRLNLGLSNASEPAAKERPFISATLMGRYWNSFRIPRSGGSSLPGRNPSRLARVNPDPAAAGSALRAHFSRGVRNAG
jgi:catechol 2,3-dioxygenase-like lactoylglutathione lyase family enzyme